jgi:hypothetical protein
MRRDDLRDLLVEAGLDILIDEGLARGTERLTFKRVFDRVAEERGIRITNASVIGRIWTDMADYQADVLAAALENPDRAGAEETVRAAAGVLSSADLDTLEGRRAATREVIRVACAAHINAITHSRKAALNMGLRGLSVSKLPGEGETPAAESVRKAYEVYCVRWDFVFEQTFDLLGIRIRRGLSVRQLSMLAISMVEGFAIWDRIDPETVRGILQPSGPDGGDQEWSLLSIGIDALVNQLTELVGQGAEWPPPGRLDAGNPE